MLRTILFLIATLITLPVVAMYTDQSLEPEHWAALKNLFSVAATGRLLNWSLAGGILLLLLFLGSSDFSEKISAEKYPGYAAYQELVPRFWRKLW